MALPKKGRRTITVDGSRYAWRATGNDEFISLAVSLLDGIGPLMSAHFGYHHAGDYKQGFDITPYIVRQVIEYALINGWNPTEKGTELLFPAMDDKIDLRLKTDTSNKAL